MICLLFCHLFSVSICFYLLSHSRQNSPPPTRRQKCATSPLLCLLASTLLTLLAGKYYLLWLPCSCTIDTCFVVGLCLPGSCTLLATWTPFLYSVCDHPTSDYPCTGTKLRKIQILWHTHKIFIFSCPKFSIDSWKPCIYYIVCQEHCDLQSTTSFGMGCW